MVKTTKAHALPVRSIRPGVLWIVLEPAEIIDLKRIVLDHDAAGAVDLFRSAILPRVQATAQERGIGLDLVAEALPDDGLSG